MYKVKVFIYSMFQLDSALPLSNSILPAELVAGVALSQGTPVVVAGWGVTEVRKKLFCPFNLFCSKYIILRNLRKQLRPF